MVNEESACVAPPARRAYRQQFHNRRALGNREAAKCCKIPITLIEPCRGDDECNRLSTLEPALTLAVHVYVVKQRLNGC